MDFRSSAGRHGEAQGGAQDVVIGGVRQGHRPGQNQDPVAVNAGNSDDPGKNFGR